MQDLELLEARIKSTAIQNFFYAAMGLALGVLLLALAASRLIVSDYQKAGFITFMAAIMIFAAWAMFQTGRSFWPARSSRVYRELTSEKPPVAWAHLTTGSTSSIKIYLLDGEMFIISANRRDAEALLTLVHRRAPYAIFGYGPEQQKLYAERVKKPAAGG